jgi:beta-galactosidase/beta-glucuronidase
MDAVDIYPRPDFNRPNLNWQLLNGAWDFTFDDNDVGITEAWYRKGLPSKQDIIVPFVFQTAASCIHDRGAHEFLWYQRRVADIRTKDELSHHHRLILRFGASDYEATVWINEQYAGFHRGGHVPFDLDITDLFQASNSIDMSTSFVISVRIRDSPYDLSQPRGKQYWKPKPESIFYTPSSGIWQSVWLESVPCVRIGHSGQGTVLKSNDVENGVLHSKISIVGRRPEQNLRVEIEASLSDISIAKLENTVSDSNSVLIDLPLSIQSKPINIPESFTKFFPSTNAKCWRNGLALWSPEYPILYKITIRLYDVSKEALLDTIETYTGMRSISWQSRCMELNGSPYFQALVLDQGYWPRTGITPPSADSLKQDIILAKRMGFNGCRKHQKVEDPIFLYWADILGFLVWGEMANAYEFNDTYMERFNDEWISAVKRDINHPCIVTWTPVNESWGYDDLPGSAQQRNHLRSLYFMTR